VGNWQRALDVVREKVPFLTNLDSWYKQVLTTVRYYHGSGVDLFDLSRSRIANANGLLLTSDGPRHADYSLGENVNMEAQLGHWRYSIASLRSAIRSGTVRELAEKSSLSSPRSVRETQKTRQTYSVEQGAF